MNKLETLSIHLMNTDFYIALPEGTSPSWKEPVIKWLQYVEKEWSRFQPGNELDRLNQLPIGETIEVSPSLYQCLKQANDYYIQTDGLFSPYLKSQIEQHGYNQSFPFDKAQQQSMLQAASLQPPIQLQPNNTILKTGDQQIDLGGFAKGFAVENIARSLQQQTSSPFGLVDGGGDMRVWSNGEKDWRISIANPYNENEDLSFINIKNGAIATSNRIYRSWKQGQETKHHLLNGQTGEVAKTDVIQATVVANSLCDAEVMTKLCFLMNDEQMQQWLTKTKIKTAQFIVKEHETGYWRKGGEA